MLKIKQLSKKYKNIEILHAIDLTIEERSWIMLVGESGAGKTTLLKAIANEISFEGQIETNGAFISFAHQENDLLEECTVLENCICNISENITSEQLDELLKYTELDQIKNQSVNTLSGGQQQRVSIIRSILQMPDILLLDEPTAHLDEQTTQIMMNVFKAYSKIGTIIMVTHDESLCELADVVYRVVDGNCVEEKKENHSSQLFFKQSKHRFNQLMLLRKEMKYNRSIYFKMILSISIGIMVLLSSMNIGRHFSNEVAELIENSYESKRFTVALEDSIDESKIDQFLKGYDVYQINTGYECIDTFNPIRINDHEIKVKYDHEQTILKEKAKFAISSKLANDLQLKLGQEISVILTIIDEYESKMGYRLAGKEKINSPIFIEKEFKWTIDDIVTEKDEKIYLTREALREVKEESHLAEALKVKSFTVTFINKNDYEKAKQEFTQQGYQLFTIEKEIQNTRNSLLSQFAPLRYISIFLCMILVITFIMLLKSIQQHQHRQYYCLTNLHVSWQSILKMTILRNLIIFVSIFMLATVFYLITSTYLNYQFNPLEYCSFHPYIYPLIQGHQFEMISIKNSSFIIQIGGICLGLFIVMNLYGGLVLKSLHKETEHNEYK